MSIDTDFQIKLNDGCYMGYSQYGDPEGIPVIHLHGTPSSRFEASNPEMDRITKDLHVRYIAPDRPGIGISDWKPYSISSYPDIVAEFADKLGLDQFSVIGVSCGGPYAIACAWKIPQRLKSAISVSGLAPFGIAGVKEALSKSERQQYELADKLPWLTRLFLWKFAQDARKNPSSIFSMFENMAAADKDLLTQIEAKQVLVKMINGAFEQGTRAVTYDTALMTRPWGFSLDEVKFPVHVWQGEADTLVPLKHAEVLAELIPNAQARYFPSEGHMMFGPHFVELLETIIG